MWKILCLSLVRALVRHLLAPLLDFILLFAVFQQLVDMMACRGSARLHKGSKVICLKLTQIKSTGREEERRKIDLLIQQEERIENCIVSFWDEPTAS